MRSRSGIGLQHSQNAHTHNSHTFANETDNIHKIIHTTRTEMNNFKNGTIDQTDKLNTDD